MSDGIFSCGVAPIGAAPVVFNQVDLLNRRVDQTFALTLGLADRLSNYTISNLSFNIDPTVVQSYAIRDYDPDLEFRDVEFDDFGPVPLIGEAFITTPPLPTGEPTAPGDAPLPVIPVSPVLYHPSFGATPTLLGFQIPTYGDITSGIEFPELRNIVLPVAPVIDFGIPFTAIPPTFSAVAPDARDFSYVEQAYTPLLVDEIKAVIQAMCAGTTGLPRVVEDALFSREAEREADTAAAALREAFNEMSVRGFSMPNGPLQSKLMQTRQDSQNKRADLGRAVMIRVHEVLVDQLKFGVAQGIALENTWIGLYNEVQNRRLQAAQVAVNIAISVYNALVSQYQAAGAIYKVQADVYATRIQAELAKLQGYSEQIKAQQLIGEINEQAIRIYVARLSAIETNVKVYLGEIEAYKALTDTERLKLESFRTTIEIEREKVSATQLELQAWSGQLQGQQLIQSAYQTRAQTYLGNVQAWKTKYEAQIDRQRGEIAALEAQTARYLAMVQGVVAKANYQTAVGGAIVADNTAKVQKFTAEAQLASGYNQAVAEKIKLLNDANAQNTQIALKNGEINAQNGLAVAQSLEQAIQAATQVLAQMTSSFASSVNMGASVSDSTSFSQSCSYNTSQTFDH